MGWERSRQCKPMLSIDKALGDTYAVIRTTFNDSFTFWKQDTDSPGANSPSVPNCPSQFALGVMCSPALSVWQLPSPQITDHSVPK